jgi:hypothetical protein
MSRNAKKKKSWSPPTPLRLLVLVAALLLCAYGAVLVRDAGLGLWTSESFVTWFGGVHRPWSLADALINAALLVALTVLLIWAVLPLLRRLWQWSRKRWKPAMEASANNSALVGDFPLVDPALDDLERYRFATEIATTIVSDDPSTSLVVAIEGPWGEGKTTVLNWIWQALEEHPTKPLLVDFDPWPEDSKRGAVSRLLDCIANALAARSDLPAGAQLRVTELFTRLADAASQDRPSSYGVIRQLVTWLIYPDRSRAILRPHSGLAADRDQLRESIARLGRRLVIFADDLDRADGDELRAVLLAINALSTFTNTTVVIAFDPTVVDAVLESRGHTSGGSTFREKIVQLSATLPPPRGPDRQQLLEKTLAKNLAALNATDFWNHWRGDYVPQTVIMAAEIARSPRSLKRLAMHTAYIVARLRTEVNSGDVLLLEVLRAHFPPVWHYLRANAGSIQERRLTDLLRSNRKEDVPTPIDNAVAQIKGSPAEAAARQVLNFLFPQYAEHRSHQPGEPSEESQSRVSLERNLSKYFHLGVARNDVSDEDARRFLSDPAVRAEVIKECLSRGTIAILFSIAARHVDRNEPVAEPAALAHAVMDASARAWRDKRLNATDEATLLLYNVVRSHPLSERFEVARSIAVDPISVSVSESLVLELMKHADIWPPRQRLPDPSIKSRFVHDQLIQNEQLHELRAAWVEAAWAVGLERIFDSEPEAMSIVFRLGQLCNSEGEDYSRVQPAMDIFLQDSARLLQFVSNFSAKVRGVSYGIDGADKLMSDYDAFLARVVHLSEPADAVAKFRSAYNRRHGRETFEDAES